MKKLARVLGLPGAVLLGLGSILGTGVFVSLGLGADAAGAWLLPALGVAGLLAACNGLSSAQLAAAHPTSGGSYEYGCRFLNPWLGFAAGWMFLVAKSSSAATAALGGAGYMLDMAGAPSYWRTPLAFLIAAAITLLVRGGLRRSNHVNAVLVAVTLGALAAFCAAVLPRTAAALTLPPFEPRGFLKACALMFVAYTGYGRVATLGEEVVDPQRTIARAVIVTLAVSATLYIAVAYAAVGAVGADAYGLLTRATAAPLYEIARTLGFSRLAPLLAAAAVTAMLGVLLNLVLGLSRVLFAMGRRGDMPRALAKAEHGNPSNAVAAVGALICALTLLGSVKTTWTFSAFAVLVYYAITNLAALRMPKKQRRFPDFIAWLGLGGCLLLAFHVDAVIWGAGLAVLAAGLAWHKTAGAGRR